MKILNRDSLEIRPLLPYVERDLKPLLAKATVRQLVNVCLVLMARLVGEGFSPGDVVERVAAQLRYLQEEGD